jgi:hypothetical protein
MIKKSIGAIVIGFLINGCLSDSKNENQEYRFTKIEGKFAKYYPSYETILDIKSYPEYLSQVDSGKKIPFKGIKIKNNKYYLNTKLNDTVQAIDLECYGPFGDTLRCPLNPIGLFKTWYLIKSNNRYYYTIERLEYRAASVNFIHEGNEDISSDVDSLITNVGFDSLKYFSGKVIYE